MKKFQRAAVAAALTTAAVGLVGVGATANATTAARAPHPGGAAFAKPAPGWLPKTVAWQAPPAQDGHQRGCATLRPS